MKIRYDNLLGIKGNIARLFEIVNEILPVEKRNESNIAFNDNKAEQKNLQLQADIVESVVDEYTALTEV